jgi:hypothetical protein
VKGDDAMLTGSLETVQQGHAAGVALEALSATLDEENRRIDEDAFREIEANTMTPEKAMELWHRRHGMYRIVRHLKKRVVAGELAARTVPDASRRT